MNSRIRRESFACFFHYNTFMLLESIFWSLTAEFILTKVLEKARNWHKINHEDDIHSRCGLANIEVTGHIQ